MMGTMIYHFYNSKFDAYHQTVNFPVFQPELSTFPTNPSQVFLFIFQVWILDKVEKKCFKVLQI